MSDRDHIVQLLEGDLEVFPQDISDPEAGVSIRAGEDVCVIHTILIPEPSTWFDSVVPDLGIIADYMTASYDQDVTEHVVGCPPLPIARAAGRWGFQLLSEVPGVWERELKAWYEEVLPEKIGHQPPPYPGAGLVHMSYGEFLTRFLR